MRLRIDWKTTSGAAALLASLVLASPGVRLVRAEDGPKTQVPVETHGPSCPAGPDAQEVAQLAPRMSEARAAAATAAPASRDLPIPLNNRGYNYVTPPAPELAKILRELRER